jgi:hypothetical protein
MLRNAAQIDSLQIARQHIRDAICDGILEFPEGYDIFEYYLEKDKYDK